MYAIIREGGYITGTVAGVAPAHSNCTEAEFMMVRDMLRHPPNAPEGFYPRLREELAWEMCEVPEISGEISDTEALAIILGEVSV